MAKEMGYTMRVINTADIFSNAGYQRPIDVKEVRKIVTHWDENQVNPPKVSYRNGKFYVFDGQHTINALKLRNNGKDVDVLCRVYTGLTYEDEARLFAAQNGISKAVSKAQRVKALYEAKDPDVMAVLEIVLSHGRSDLSAMSDASKQFWAFAKALDIYKKRGANRVDTIMGIIDLAWGTDFDGYRSKILSGLNILLDTYPNEVKVGELAKRLSLVTPTKIEAEAAADNIHRGAKGYAFQMVLAYNKGRKKASTRLDEREIR